MKIEVRHSNSWEIFKEESGSVADDFWVEGFCVFFYI